MKKQKSYQRGITLIALVVTIIVLMIISGITVAALMGDNGIIKRAGDAKIIMNEAQIRERIRLAYSSALTKDISNQKAEVQKSTFEDELKIEFPGEPIDIGESANKKEWVVTIDGVTENVPIGKDTPKSNGKLASEIFEASGTTEGKMHVGDYVNYPVYYDNVNVGEGRS